MASWSGEAFHASQPPLCVRPTLRCCQNLSSRRAACPWRPAADGKNGESYILPWQRHRELHFGRVEVLANRLPFGKIAGFYILSWQKPRFLRRLRRGVAKAIREPQVRGSSLPRFSGVSRWTNVKHAGFAKEARQRGVWRGLFGDDERAKSMAGARNRWRRTQTAAKAWTAAGARSASAGARERRRCAKAGVCRLRVASRRLEEMPKRRVGGAFRWKGLAFATFATCACAEWRFKRQASSGEG